MPDRRKGYTQKAVVGGHKVYLRTGEYDDGRARRDLHRHAQGRRRPPLLHQQLSPSRSRSACNTACRWRNMSTPSPSPASSRRGPVQGNDSIKYATSILDYVFRELAVSYMRALRPRACRSQRVAASTRSARAWRKASLRPRPTTCRRGLTRSRTDRLSVVAGATVYPRRQHHCARSVGGPRAEVAGTTALKAEHGSEAFTGRTARAPRRYARCPSACKGVGLPTNAPKPAPRATKAKPVASAVTSHWCATAPA